jgi:hypothetical protein
MGGFEVWSGEVFAEDFAMESLCCLAFDAGFGGGAWMEVHVMYPATIIPMSKKPINCLRSIELVNDEL